MLQKRISWNVICRVRKTRKTVLYLVVVQCSNEIIPLISDHRQIEVLRNIIDIHILRSQILHTFTFPLLNRPIFRMFRMYKRPKFRMFRQCFLCQHFPVLNVITAVSSCSHIFFLANGEYYMFLIIFFSSQVCGFNEQRTACFAAN